MNLRASICFVASTAPPAGFSSASYNNKTAANARRFLRELERACQCGSHILYRQRKEFTDRLFGLRKTGADGKHEFRQALCTEPLDIEHRLTRQITSDQR